jgi:hypothetical protein
VFDASVIDPAYPDYDEMRAIVDKALSPASATPAADTPASSGPAEPAGEAPEGGEEPAQSPITDIGDACAYDPVQARKARAAGEPPTHR